MNCTSTTRSLRQAHIFPSSHRATSRSLQEKWWWSRKGKTLTMYIDAMNCVSAFPYQMFFPSLRIPYTCISLTSLLRHAIDDIVKIIPVGRGKYLFKNPFRHFDLYGMNFLRAYIVHVIRS